MIGVRHHSPACARLVAGAIRGRRPRRVLVEGPSDLNGRLGELDLPHELPVAVFTYLAGPDAGRACWTPFCDYSPEWVALREGAAAGAERRFIDLPGWHDAFAGVSNRYSDRHERWSRAVAELCRRTGVDEFDSLWDHLFEQPDAGGRLAQRLQHFFAELRALDAATEADAVREEHMGRWVAAAAAEPGLTLVVCGGFHAPVLAAAPGRLEARPPEAPSPPAGHTVGSYLVPYSFHRLDSFTGYESGMPSPAYQQALWELGPAAAADTMLAAATSRLRERRQRVSTADLVAARSLIEGLRRLRGHAAASRTDLLDGLAGAVVKEALDQPLPWTARGTIRAGSDPLLVEVLRVLSGERVGRLAAGTPEPPLVADAAAQLEAHGLTPARAARTVDLDLADAPAQAASRLLHRLRLLRVGGFERLSGPEWATGRETAERWRLRAVARAQSDLVEAARYGPTLAAAARARLEELLQEGEGRLAHVARTLALAVLAGVIDLEERLLGLVERGVGQEPDLEELGRAQAALLALYRHDVLLGSAGAPALAAVLRAGFERGLWLWEGLRGTRPPGPDQLAAAVALRDTLRHAGERLGLDREAAVSVMRRSAGDPGVPPGLRGAAAGFLWAVGAEDAASPAHGIRAAGRPEQLGDFLTGLFALARAEVAASTGVLETIDPLVTAMGETDFLVALPSLRLAFSYFPPAERAEIGTHLLRLHGRAGDADLLRLDFDPRHVTRARDLEARVAAWAAAHGLDGES